MAALTASRAVPPSFKAFMPALEATLANLLYLIWSVFLWVPAPTDIAVLFTTYKYYIYFINLPKCTATTPVIFLSKMIENFAELFYWQEQAYNLFDILHHYFVVAHWFKINICLRLHFNFTCIMLISNTLIQFQSLHFTSPDRLYSSNLKVLLPTNTKQTWLWFWFCSAL